MTSICRAFAAVCAVSLASMCASAQAANDIVLTYKGDAVPNRHAAPTTDVFKDWCRNNCAPSVHLPVYNAKNNRLEGQIYVWTTPFTTSADNKSFCFNEFIMFVLDEGTLYTASHFQGVCGGTVDPSLKASTRAAAPAMLVAGGGDGLIVGGTGKYRKWRGTYTDRVFVELSYAPNGVNYYDQLIFIISKDE